MGREDKRASPDVEHFWFNVPRFHTVVHRDPVEKRGLQDPMEPESAFLTRDRCL